MPMETRSASKERTRQKQLKQAVRSPGVSKRHKLFQALTGKTRYLILNALYRCPDGLTVSQVADILDASPSRTSHQLAILRRHDVIQPMRAGRMVTYRLAKPWRKRELFAA